MSNAQQHFDAQFYCKTYFICFSYESANGIKAEESGDVKNKGSDNAIQTVQGSYSYTSPEGEVIQVE